MNVAFLKGNKLVQLTARSVQMRPNLGSDIWNCATANVVSARWEAAKRFACATARPSVWRRNRFQFRSQIRPRLKSPLPRVGVSGGAFRLSSIGDLAMVPAQPLHNIQERIDGSPFGREDDTFDEFTDDDVVSLLEENARLRKLVVRLSEIVLRNVADTK